MLLAVGSMTADVPLRRASLAPPPATRRPYSLHGSDQQHHYHHYEEEQEDGGVMAVPHQRGPVKIDLSCYRSKTGRYRSSWWSMGGKRGGN